MARINKILLALFVFFLPWQTKYILIDSPLNYWEISIFVSSILLTLVLISNFSKLIKNINSLNKYLLISLIVFDLSLFISIFLSPNILLSIYKYIVFILAILLLILLINHKNKLYLLLVFSLSISLHSLIAIFQFITQASWSSKYLGLSHHYAWSLGTAVVEVNGERWLRAYGALDHPNILGALALLSLVISVYYLLFKKNSLKLRLFLYLNFFISLSALMFSFSKSAWLAFFVFIISLFFYRIKNKATARLIIIGSVILMSVFYLNYTNLINARLTGQGRIEQISINERKDSLNLVHYNSKQQLFFGRGIGASSFWQKEADIKDGKHLADYHYQPVHNIFLLLFLEIGIFGLIAFLAIISSLIIIYKKRISYLFLIPILIFALFDHWLLSLHFGVLLLFFFLSFVSE